MGGLYGLSRYVDHNWGLIKYISLFIYESKIFECVGGSWAAAAGLAECLSSGLKHHPAVKIPVPAWPNVDISHP